MNRVGQRYVDQLALSGHYNRWRADLDGFAALGIAAIRYPILWETTTAADGSLDWSRSDGPLLHLRDIGVRPIVGLLHHGSGPPFTDLLDPDFPRLFARYARCVAERYPWVTDWTPINEPLTTARFSALYGHWYPHAASPQAMIRALFNQLAATRAAIDEIRTVNPAARLIQTEDAGVTSGPQSVREQVEFENHRRWLSLDLLFGRVTREHELWKRLVADGANVAELDELAARQCRPDVVGLNYYVTSDRRLDDDMRRYPIESWGGNGRQHYADVETVRAGVDGIAGHEALLRAAWSRYRTPVAFTEVHLGSTREEQLRWLAEAWHATVRVRTAGIPAPALTVWSLLGSFDWNSLVTRLVGFYEPGPFDVRSLPPRPTALATMTKALASDGSFAHPVLESDGWWRRPDRLWPPFRERNEEAVVPTAQARPLLITGARGTLGRAFTRICRRRGLAHVALDRQELDITSRESVREALDRWRPWAVINAAGYVRVDEAETDAAECMRQNANGPLVLAEASALSGTRLVVFSSDLVFGEGHDQPLVESSPTSPLNAYGRSKLSAEWLVAATLPTALIVRTSAFFGPWDTANFVFQAWDRLCQGMEVVAASDTTVSPTFVPDLVDAALDLLIDEESGVWHLANDGATTWAELAREVAALAGVSAQLVRPVAMADLMLSACRPHFSALGSERGRLLPAIGDAVTRWLAEHAASPARAEASAA